MADDRLGQRRDQTESHIAGAEIVESSSQLELDGLWERWHQLAGLMSAPCATVAPAPPSVNVQPAAAAAAPPPPGSATVVEEDEDEVEDLLQDDLKMSSAMRRVLQERPWNVHDGPTQRPGCVYNVVTDMVDQFGLDESGKYGLLRSTPHQS